MKRKTSDLTSYALDWAVAKCEGLPLKLDPMGFRKDSPESMQAGWWVWDGEGQNQIIGHRKTRRGEEDGYSPSTDWTQGGPIIEREKLDVMWCGDRWCAYAMTPDKETQLVDEGPTPLVAAMRCYVATRLGEEVDIPQELQ